MGTVGESQCESLIPLNILRIILIDETYAAAKHACSLCREEFAGFIWYFMPYSMILSAH